MFGLNERRESAIGEGFVFAIVFSLLDRLSCSAEPDRFVDGSAVCIENHDEFSIAVSGIESSVHEKRVPAFGSLFDIVCGRPRKSGFILRILVLRLFRVVLQFAMLFFQTRRFFPLLLQI
jgi:hypothetical protein